MLSLCDRGSDIHFIKKAEGKIGMITSSQTKITQHKLLKLMSFKKTSKSWAIFKASMKTAIKFTGTNEYEGTFVKI